MIKLTDWETGEPIYVIPSAIVSIRQLKAETTDDYGDIPHEMGRRTRIDTPTDIFLVREDAEGIYAML